MADIEKAAADLQEIKDKIIPAIARMYGSGFSSVFACEKVEEKLNNAIKLLKEQHSISVDMFIQWCVDSQIMGEATRNGLKYWVDKFKEWKSIKDGDGE